MTSRRLRLRGLAFAVCAAILWVLLPATADAAEDGTGDLHVTIDALTPARLTSDATITLSGRIENTGRGRWTAVQAYLVMARSPFTTREQVEALSTDDSTYIGDRIITPGLFDEVGDLGAGDSTTYQLEVPLSEVGVTGAQGVYPVGVQLLATDPDGRRSKVSVARATTFLPWVSDPADAPIPAGLVWSFLLGPRLDSEADDVKALRDAIVPSGRMREQLDLAAASPTSSRTLVIDPAVLDAVHRLARDERIPADAEIDEDDRRAAGAFLEDLVALARGSATWVVDYDRPDLAALARDQELHAVVAPKILTATTDALAEHQVSGRRAHWSVDSGVTSGLMDVIRAEGDGPTIVRASALPDWEQRHGSLVTVATASGLAPIAVNDTLRAGDGAETVVTLRQRVLVQAALASLSRAVNPQSRADAVTFVDPAWVPSAEASATTLTPALGGDGLTDPVTLDDLLATGVESYRGDLPTQPLTEPLPGPVVGAVERLAAAQSTAAAVASRPEEKASALARELSSALSTRWIDQPERAAASAAKQARQISQNLEGIEVLGPQSVTLSSSHGSFPLTISNPTPLPITVSVRLEASNPALEPASLPAVEIAPGERRTVNAEIDLGRQTSTTLTAQAMAGETRIGRPAVFNVRSSQVGTIVWIAMGVAVLGVVVAMGRRFRRRGFRRLSDTSGGSDG